jgi:hypothetical protein
MRPDEELAGYRIERLLGEGGMARVFRAYDPRTDRHVALKVLKEAWRDDPSVVERFLDEAKKNGPLGHPNIARIHRVDASPQPFIDMELVEGPTLGDYLREQGGRLPPEQVARIGRDLASALSHAHRLGRVHRDVKPGNVMMADEGRTPKLVDFGIAMIDRPEAVRLTQHGEMVGTPRYMAPEQVRGEKVDGRTDLYALGTVLYELLAGRPAVAGDSLVTVTTRIVTEAPPALRGIAPKASAALVRAIERLMAKDPGSRFASAGEAMTALEGCLARPGGGNHEESGDGRPPGGKRGPAMSRWLIGAVALVALAVLGGVGYVLVVPPVLPTGPVTVRDTPPPPGGPGAGQRPPMVQDLEHRMSASDRQAVIRLGEIATDPDGDPLTFSAPPTPPDGPGEVRISGDLLIYEPGPAFADLPRGEERTVTVPVTVRDGGGLESRADVRVTVAGVAEAPTGPPVSTPERPPQPTPGNRAPEAGDLAEATPADQVLTVELRTLARDPDGDPLRFSAPATSDDGSGSVSVAGDLLRFDPSGAFAELLRDQERTVTVPVTARDPGDLEASALLRITVTGVRRPPPPAHDLRQAVAKADAIARGEPCARLETETAAGAAVRVLLAASDASLAGRIAQELEGETAPPPELRFAALPARAVACQVFDLINRATEPVPPRFVQLQASTDGGCDHGEPGSCYRGLERGELAEGERLVLAVEPPAGAPFLLVDYFMTDGSVAHLHPPRSADDDTIPASGYAKPTASGTVVIGDSRAGKDDPNEYPVGPPFGHELVVAMVATAPLFSADRPFVEPAAGYLAALERALDARSEGQRPKAAALWLETMARHR